MCFEYDEISVTRCKVVYFKVINLLGKMQAHSQQS
jgi:hypothetical protein